MDKLTDEQLSLIKALFEYDARNILAYTTYKNIQGEVKNMEEEEHRIAIEKRRLQEDEKTTEEERTRIEMEERHLREHKTKNIFLWNQVVLYISDPYQSYVWTIFNFTAQAVEMDDDETLKIACRMIWDAIRPYCLPSADKTGWLSQEDLFVLHYIYHRDKEKIKAYVRSGKSNEEYARLLNRLILDPRVGTQYTIFEESLLNPAPRRHPEKNNYFIMKHTLGYLSDEHKYKLNQRGDSILFSAVRFSMVSVYALQALLETIPNIASICNHDNCFPLLRAIELRNFTTVDPEKRQLFNDCVRILMRYTSPEIVSAFDLTLEQTTGVANAITSLLISPDTEVQVHLIKLGVMYPELFELRMPSFMINVTNTPRLLKTSSYDNYPFHGGEYTSCGITLYGKEALVPVRLSIGQQLQFAGVYTVDDPFTLQTFTVVKDTEYVSYADVNAILEQIDGTSEEPHVRQQATARGGINKYIEYYVSHVIHDELLTRDNRKKELVLRRLKAMYVHPSILQHNKTLIGEKLLEVSKLFFVHVTPPIITEGPRQTVDIRTRDYQNVFIVTQSTKGKELVTSLGYGKTMLHVAFEAVVKKKFEDKYTRQFEQMLHVHPTIDVLQDQYGKTVEEMIKDYQDLIDSITPPNTFTCFNTIGCTRHPQGTSYYEHVIYTLAEDVTPSTFYVPLTQQSTFYRLLKKHTPKKKTKYGPILDLMKQYSRFGKKSKKRTM